MTRLARAAELSKAESKISNGRHKRLENVIDLRAGLTPHHWFPPVPTIAYHFDGGAELSLFSNDLESEKQGTLWATLFARKHEAKSKVRDTTLN